MRLSLNALLAAFLPVAVGCHSVAPPASQIPSVDHALLRLHETQSCGHGLQGTAKIDHFSREGRVRGELLFFAVRPANLRLDIIKPFVGVTLATLTADSRKFALADLRDKHFYVGPSDPCNIARLTSVPIPGHALTSLMVGDAPVLAHEDARLAAEHLAAPTLLWDTHGYYSVHIASSRTASQTIHLAVHPDDFGKPWTMQRLRLVDLLTEQYGGVLYHAELEDHARAKMAVPRVDPEGIDAPIPISGPQCDAELPRTIHLEVPGSDEDLIFRYDEASWNPPLPAGVFTQERPPGMDTIMVSCPREPGPDTANGR